MPKKIYASFEKGDRVLLKTEGQLILEGWRHKQRGERGLAKRSELIRTEALKLLGKEVSISYESLGDRDWVAVELDGDSTVYDIHKECIDKVLSRGIKILTSNEPIIAEGDKVMLKTKEELLMEGWIQTGSSLSKKRHTTIVDDMIASLGKECTVLGVLSDTFIIEDDKNKFVFDKTCIRNIKTEPATSISTATPNPAVISKPTENLDDYFDTILKYTESEKRILANSVEEHLFSLGFKKAENSSDMEREVREHLSLDKNNSVELVCLQTEPNVIIGGGYYRGTHIISPIQNGDSTGYNNLKNIFSLYPPKLSNCSGSYSTNFEYIIFNKIEPSYDRFDKKSKYYKLVIEENEILDFPTDSFPVFDKGQLKFLTRVSNKQDDGYNRISFDMITDGHQLRNDNYEFQLKDSIYHFTGYEPTIEETISKIFKQVDKKVLEQKLLEKNVQLEKITNSSGLKRGDIIVDNLGIEMEVALNAEDKITVYPYGVNFGICTYTYSHYEFDAKIAKEGIKKKVL